MAIHYYGPVPQNLIPSLTTTKPDQGPTMPRQRSRTAQQTLPRRTTKQTGLIYQRHPLLTTERPTFWQGPYDASPSIEYGITQSMMGAFWCCRERFRLHYCEGLREYEAWERVRAMEWGSMWHEAEHAHLENRNPYQATACYCTLLTSRFPRSAIKIKRDLDMVNLMFRYYLHYYDHQYTNTNIEPIWAESEFEVEIPLGHDNIFPHYPLLRGKMDGVGLLATKVGKYTYLKENKTKERINMDLINSNLDYDNQVMVYLNALSRLVEVHSLPPVGGVVYNVIRRPRANQSLSTLEDHLRREPEHFFIRVIRHISKQELKEFLITTLQPTLYQICAWWNWIKQDPLHPFRPDHRGVPGGGYHWRQPFNVYNNLSQGKGEFYGLLTNKSSTQLDHAKTLYPELPQ